MNGGRRLSGLDAALTEWGEQDPTVRYSFLLWLADLMEDPDGSEAVPVPDVPDAWVAVNAGIEVRFLRNDQHEYLYIKEIRTL